MPIQITFNEPVNTSVQPGDTVYYVLPNLDTSGFYTASSSTTIEIGTVSTVSTFNIVVVFTGAAPVIPTGAFIMFSKDNVVNQSKVLGYYAKSKFINWSDRKVELFSVGSEVSLSSK